MKNYKDEMNKMWKNFNFDYDYKNDSLFLYDPKSKSKASVEMDDFIVDFNKNKEVTAIEILNVSKFIMNVDFDKQIISKAMLKKIKKAKVEIIKKNNFFLIKFVLDLESAKQIKTPLLVPTITESSPALVTA